MTHYSNCEPMGLLSEADQRKAELLLTAQNKPFSATLKDHIRSIPRERLASARQGRTRSAGSRRSPALAERLSAASMAASNP